MTTTRTIAKTPTAMDASDLFAFLDRLVSAANESAGTVYLTTPVTLFLDELTLSDGSTVFNIRVEKED